MYGQLAGKFTGFSRRYERMLQEHLQQGRNAKWGPVEKLGREASALGLRSRELPSFHERVMAKLQLSKGQAVLTAQANRFLNAARGALEAARAIKHPGRPRHQETDRIEKPARPQGTKQLTAANRRHPGSRRARESKPPREPRRTCYPKLLAESLKVQARLRQSAHKTFLMQETQRGVLSRHLQDEIAQALLSIQVRLLNLRTAARRDSTTLTKEIARAQRLVKQSAQSIERFAAELASEKPASKIQFDR